MKAQTEIIVFVLLFLIGLVLFMSSFVWSQGIIERNQDINKLGDLESFALKLDSTIKNVIKFGGEESIDYRQTATVAILGDNTIEFRDSMTTSVPDVWINITEDGRLKEKKEGADILIRLQYPEKDYVIKFIADGPTLANPRKIWIRKDNVVKQDGLTLINLIVILE